MRALVTFAPILLVFLTLGGACSNSESKPNEPPSEAESGSSGLSEMSTTSGATGKSGSSGGTTGKTGSSGGTTGKTGSSGGTTGKTGSSGNKTDSGPSKDVGGSASGATDAKDASSADGGDSTVVGSGLAAKYAQLFPFGIAVNLDELTPNEQAIAANFNHLTAGNSMKSEVIHPAENRWNTTEADALANFARSHGWKMTGHTLVWHRQQAAWMFQGLTAGDPTSIETLKSRLKAHIEYMVKRYNDVVDNWDVVNEAISDDGTKTYRDTSGGSDWYKYFGNEDYIYWAFKFTYDALEAEGAGNAKGKLYYNDYNETQKIDRILTMAEWLKGKGVTLDGIGFQAHHRIDWPGVSDMETAVTKAAEAGYKVKISELDITLYNDYPPPDYQFVAAPEVPFTAELEAEQATRYGAILAMLRAHAKDVTSVTVWGFSDETSWLNNEPQAGRRNYPLLFNDKHQPKASFTKIQDF